VLETAQPDLVPGAVSRGTHVFRTATDRRRYWITLFALASLGLLLAFGILAWDNPLPVGTDGFWRIAQLRATNVLVIAIVVLCQATATVAFQTVTNNRIITPSIMGFEALYVAIQTGAVYFLGAVGVIALQGLPQLGLQIALMVGFSVLLFGWLLSGRYANLHVMLLVGIVIGGGLRSVATFMQRLLTPSEFDVLTARLFGSISNADASYLPVVLPLCLVAAAGVFLCARRLNVLALGGPVAVNLGVNHRREVMTMLFLVSILMATSTALIGPMTFLGFLVAALAYQFAPTHDHRFVLPMALAAGFVVLSGAYFVLKNVFYAEGAVSIIIEAVGGTAFLVVLLRKGRL
jgi:iron complex transport system permease protein